METVTIYGLAMSTYVRSICIVCQYKKIDHKITIAPYGDDIPLYSDEHAALHPFKKMPVLIHNDLVIPESYAIANYLNALTGPTIFPEDSTLRAETDSYAQIVSCYIAETITKGVLLEFGRPKGKDGEVRLDVVKENLPAMESSLKWLNERLEEQRFLAANQFTFADTLLIPILNYCTQLPEPFKVIEQYPALLKYTDYHLSQNYCNNIFNK